MTYSPSTSSSSVLPFSKLAGCFTTTPSSPPHIYLVAVIGLLCLILSIPLAVLCNLISPSEIGQSVTSEDYTSLWTPRLLGQ
ncbi:hypothetical protein K443DRAFT_686387 [Laccaria amethystina LaAM-08-1]|uniref:Uncharacterized protein n=1 Tax=Laccaria amethystina LaAM-08-1 TaxID=1095629 RepID=A0A0C9WHC3_9AGAR|nr:hypothetical protein K443DRAFT_686387 [Laccaria amethystina LaAM-08-1]